MYLSRGVSCVLVVIVIAWLTCTGCSHQVFVAEMAFVNGGQPGQGPLVTPEMAREGLEYQPTEATLTWTSPEGDARTSVRRANMAVIYYGRKVKPAQRVQEGAESARGDRRRPTAVPNLVLVKTLMDGKNPVGGLFFDAPPPSALTYRFMIYNSGTADYAGKLELVDDLPAEVHFSKVSNVYALHYVPAPFVGPIERKSEITGWKVETPAVGASGRFRWAVDQVVVKKAHWVIVDIQVEPPPFNLPVSSSEMASKESAAKAPPRAYLGVKATGMSPDLARAFDFDGFGLLITKVFPNSPAEKSGIKVGDILTKCDRTIMQSPQQLIAFCRERSPGTRIEVEVSRDGALSTMPVSLLAPPDGFKFTTTAPAEHK